MRSNLSVITKNDTEAIKKIYEPWLRLNKEMQASITPRKALEILENNTFAILKYEVCDNTYRPWSLWYRIERSSKRLISYEWVLCGL